MTITRGQFKRLMAVYATDQARSVKSQLGDRRGGAPGSCILTIGVIIAHTPSRYRIRGEGVSILQRWCEARAAETVVEYQIAVARVRDRFGPKVKDLEHQLGIVVEHTYGIESRPLFDDALGWAAADLSRRLSRVHERELNLWMEFIDEKVSA